MDRNTIDELITKLRELAGAIGSQDELENAPDAENYDFQVQTGLAEAVVKIMDYDSGKLIFWIGRCLIQFGLNPNDRIKALLDALAHEVVVQLEELHDADDADDAAK